ncbi:Ig-like domain-containing protein [Bacillus sp. SJS]|uniref:Ig-like domain-containing protein n=1 Tax=Bacillus sp. SJS TaxID=1423321 RepID=UPI0004DD2476|nr:Ig-like domain-containing protein [Bacillus sp. SJS]KZZ85045.1 hypothetical protein AS29_008330 [Bacillus sp. SJS]
MTETDVEALANYKMTAVTTGGAATVGSVELQADKKSAIVTLGTEAQNQETYKLEVKNVKDTKGTVIATTEKEVKFFDATAPTATKVDVVAPRTVKVSFSEPLKTVPTVKLGNGSISTTVTLSADKKSATVEFGIEPTIGTQELEIQGGADYANLKIEKAVKSFDYQKDATAPTASVEKATANTVTLKFSKPVSVKTASDVSVYHTINNSGAYVGGALTPVTGTVVNGYSDTYTVAFGTPIPEGTAKVFLNTKANALEDGWGNDVASTELSSTVVVDKAAPKVTGVKAVSDKKLEVTFDEDVNATDAQKLSNYILKNGSGSVLSSDDYDFVNTKGEFLNTVTVSYSAKKATITLPSSLKGGNYSLTVKEIKDASFLENKLTSQDTAVVIADTTSWDITGNALRSTDNKKIRVTFNEAMSAEGLTDLSKYELRNGSGTKVDFPTDSKVVVLNPKTVEIQLGGTGETTATTLRVSGTLKDASGNTFNELYKQVTIGTESGATLVANTAKTTSTNKVTFEVDQELQGSLNTDNFTISGAQVFGGASYVNKDGKSTVTLTLKDSATKFTTSATPTVTVAADALTNVYGAKNADSISVAAVDGIAPSVLKNSTTGKLEIKQVANTVDNISIQYDEELTTTNASLAATDLVITDSATGKTLVAGVDYNTAIAADSDTLTIDLIGADYNNFAGKVTVASKSTPVYIKDAASKGNASNAFAATEVTLGDITAPTLAATYPKATPGATASKQATMKVQSNEAGTAYFLVVADGATAPTEAAIVANNVTVALTAGAEATKTLTFTADNTAYDVYVVVKDAAGNATAPVKVDVTTPAAV